MHIKKGKWVLSAMQTSNTHWRKRIYANEEVIQSPAWALCAEEEISRTFDY